MYNIFENYYLTPLDNAYNWLSLEFILSNQKEESIRIQIQTLNIQAVLACATPTYIGCIGTHAHGRQVTSLLC